MRDATKYTVSESDLRTIVSGLGLGTMGLGFQNGMVAALLLALGL